MTWNRRLFTSAAAAAFAASLRAAAKKRVLILCTGNSCRSQMTEAFLRSLDPRLEVYSAGTNPAARVHPAAVKAMSEIGIDISAAKPKHVSQFLDQPFDYLITVCSEADENCPLFRGKVDKRAHIGFDDPAKATGTDEQVFAVFRRVRDEIRERFTDYYRREIKPAL